ncbi:histidine phosphatase family protein [Guggenheimella bovis]
MILIRHPNTLANESKRFPTPDVEYSELGKEQYDALLEKDITGTIIYSSPYRRCLLLATALFKKLQVPLVVDHRLREIDCGDFIGYTFEEIEERFPEEVEEWMKLKESFRYPNGESLDELHSRVESFMKDLPKGAIVITHQAVLYFLSQKKQDTQTFETGEMRTYED